MNAPLSLAYAQSLPGLVHFLVINRSSHRLLAPQLSELFPGVPAQQQLLRRSVWQLCALALQHGSLVTASVVRRSDFV